MTTGYTFDSDRFGVGTLCNRGHSWAGASQSLRRLRQGKPTGMCLECEKISIANRGNTIEKTDYYKEYRRQYCAQNRKRRNAYKQQIRQGLREQGLTTRGTAPVNINGAATKEKRNEALALEKVLRLAIRTAGNSPSVARLVMNEQLRYWRENPKAKAKYDRQWAKDSWWLKYQINPDLRLYHREKSKRRKAVIKERTAVKISPKQLLQRFAVFGDCCAYCGKGGDMQIEHAVPIANGGTHAVGNILPACQTCNYSKRDKEIQSWYESQPFFSKARWNKICRVLGWSRGAVNQLALV